VIREIIAWTNLAEPSLEIGSPIYVLRMHRLSLYVTCRWSTIRMWGRNRILGVSARKDKAAQRLTAAGGELDPRPPFPAIPAIAVTNQYCKGETRTEKSVKDREPRMICLNFQGEQNISIYLTERIRRTAYSIEGMYWTVQYGVAPIALWVWLRSTPAVPE